MSKSGKFGIIKYAVKMKEDGTDKGLVNKKSSVICENILIDQSKCIDMTQ